MEVTLFFIHLFLSLRSCCVYASMNHVRTPRFSLYWALWGNISCEIVLPFTVLHSVWLHSQS